MEVKPGYKLTEVGGIPEDWNVTRLGDCLAARPSYGINAAAVPFSDRLPVYIRITDISEDGRFLPSQRVSVRSAMSADYYLSDGDIVFARTGASVGKSYRYNSDDGPLVYAGFLIRVRPDSGKLLPAFAAAYVTTGNYWRWVRLMSMRSGQPGINGNEYAQLPVPLPPLPEQRAIASALSDVDALLGRLERLIAKKRDLKQAAMQQLLTGQTRLPGFSGEWEVKRLGDLFKFSGGYSASRDQLSTEGHCYLHYGDIHGSSKTTINTKADHQDIPKLNIPLKRVSPDSLLADGDVVFVDASEDDEGTSKHVVVVNKGGLPFISGLHTIIAKPRTAELAHEYLRYCFQTAAIRWQFMFYAVGTKVSGISKTNIVKLTLPVPSVAEQTAIAAVLSDMDAELSALVARRDKTRDLKQAMMQELLTGKTRLVPSEVAHA
jgi:type I restriction enzyme S subunit